MGAAQRTPHLQAQALYNGDHGPLLFHQETAMLQPDNSLMRRDFLAKMLAGAALLQAQFPRSRARAEEAPRDVFFERAAEGTPHRGKVLMAVQAHSDDIPLSSAGTVAKLVKEGYTG